MDQRITEKKGFYFLPLGGADDIGMNMYAYKAADKWIVVDAGYGFLSDDYKSMDMCYASPSFLQTQKENVEALFITHAHEDHMGAIAQIWKALECPVYATAFASKLIQKRLEEYKIANLVDLHEVRPQECVKTQNFEVQFVELVHSVPETCGLFIKTGFGNVFHATDWRFDDGRLDMLHTDEKTLYSIGQQGVDLFVCDSTNILIEHQQPSEFQIRQNLFKLIGSVKGGLVATCFASNLMRLESLVLAAYHCHRTPILVGKTLSENIKLAKDCGYFKNLPEIYNIETAADVPSDNALYICTGSQANYKSALSMIANGENKYIKLGVNDTVLFSSKIIPGNEEKIKRMQEKLMDEGVSVITEQDENIHTSGHCSQDEIRKMYEILQPTIVFPVHGDKNFIKAHMNFALNCGIKKVCSAKRGEMFWINAGQIEKIGSVDTQVIGVDHMRSVPLDSELVKNRMRIAYHGTLFASLVVSKQLTISDLQISSDDILAFDDWKSLIEEIKPNLLEQIETILSKDGLTQQSLDNIKSKIRKAVYKKTDVKPVTTLHVYQEQ